MDEAVKGTSAASGPPSTGQSKAIDSNRKTPDEWAKALKTKTHHLAGAKAHAGWRDDQPITKTEFERKLAEWLHRPIGSRKGVK